MRLLELGHDPGTTFLGLVVAPPSLCLPELVEESRLEQPGASVSPRTIASPSTSEPPSVVAR